MTKRRRRKQSLFMWCSDRWRDSETSLLLRTLEEEHKELHKLISNLAGKLVEKAVSWKVSDEELDRFENADMVRLEALISSMTPVAITCGSCTAPSDVCRTEPGSQI